MNSDAIEMRVRYYANYVYLDRPHAWRVDIAADAPGHVRQFLLSDNMIARTDGGDYGDEDD